MTKDCYGTCPKCGEIGWCHYKGKARIFKSGPGSDLYKVSLFKCGNCGKKFGFELEDGVMEPKLNEEEDDDWEKITEILAEAYEDLNASWNAGDVLVIPTMRYLEGALNITRKHCGRDS